MIVTVTISQENGESSERVTASEPSLPAEGWIRRAILNAGIRAIADAKDEGWLDY